MNHCDEIVAIAVSKRIGGKAGYDLLLANVKSSLPFSFLNGASSYAGFCIRLLLAHYSSSPFHQKFKQSLYSSSHNQSSVNFGLDTSREIDHRTANKCIRPGSTMASLIPKMAIVDDQRQVHATRKSLLIGVNEEDDLDLDNRAVKSCASKYLLKQLSANDKEHIIRTAKLVLKMKALSLEEDKIPRNVYHPSKPELSDTVLDKATYALGDYLIRRFCCVNTILEFTEKDMPNIAEYDGPKVLINRIKAMKSVTINRTRCKPKAETKLEHQKTEEKRQKKVQRMSKVIDCFSSVQNTCQAVVKPDCSKASTNKSLGVKKALRFIIKKCFTNMTGEADVEENISNLLLFNFKEIPNQVSQNAVVSVVEFPGAKFKAFASTGDSYLRYISTGIIKKLLKELPNLQRIVICEEKYSFTPDDFKAATRLKRQTKDHITIAHLKDENEIISTNKFNKKAAISTGLGKKAVSNYLGTHLHQLDIKANICIDVDSEAFICRCQCSSETECTCIPYAKPVRSLFKKDTGFDHTDVIPNIKQRKGEAEMAQADWLMDLKDSLEEGQCVINYVTSADIDTVVIHLFAVSLFWPRYENGAFKWPVYIWLQKQKPEIYDITGILTILEKSFNNRFIGAILAIVLSMGGNDYLPNFHGISHEKLVDNVPYDPEILESLLQFKESTRPGMEAYTCTLKEETYIKLYSKMYYPRNIEPNKLTVEEIQQFSVKDPGKIEFKHPQMWMPPVSALRQLAKLVQCQINYFLTVCLPDASLPNFLALGCLAKREDGTTFYNLGPESHIEERQSLIKISEDQLEAKIKGLKSARTRKSSKRQQADTPQKEKPNKRQPMMSTPRKIQARRKIQKD